MVGSMEAIGAVDIAIGGELRVRLNPVRKPARQRVTSLLA
jgi:hypothetical protein